jgi:tRNA A-37 threonylcarbamoyl transferase component Bud32
MPDNELNPTVPRTPPAHELTADHVPDDTSARAAPRAPAEAPAGTNPRTPSDAARQEAEARVRAAAGVPGYVLLRELGRGGMGVVHEARHVKLNRVVALKMMLGGEQASRSELIRFLAEAEAVAAVKHENVVQVYDYGDADGRPFMALEFCPGGTLRKLLPQTPAEAHAPARMAALVAKVARGVAAAHALGIVHRDLKPGNVFLDDAGIPKVADFGLAKRGEGADVTQEGQGMGSPAYMAPEQAKDAKFVGPQADVWALGVILYEALTGTRPFVGTVREILARAEKTDPVPPRKVVAAVPHDLEQICLHCLAKQPHERYPTAKELADDLDRYARNEPISVRPAGPVERGYKWVKRNKVVSASAAAVFLALSVGLGLALGFGIEAQNQATEANKQRKDANDAKDDAIQKTADAIRAKTEAQAAQERYKLQLDQTTGALARRTLAALRSDGFGRSLAQEEADALWELASLRETAVPQRFVEEAAATPLGSAQLATRAEFAVHAAVGLDPVARETTARLLLARMAAPGVSTDQRGDLAVALSYLGPLPPADAEAVARALAAALNDTASSTVRAFLAERLAAAATHAPQPVAAELCKTASVRLLTAMNELKSNDPLLIAPLARGAALLGARLDPEATARTFAAEILKPREVDLYLARQDLAEGLASAAERMEPAAGTAIVLDTLAKTNDWGATSLLVESLVRLARRLDARAAADAAKTLAAMPRDLAKRDGLRPLARGLPALLARMDVPAQEEAAGKVAESLTAEMKKAANPFQSMECAAALAALTAWMKPADASATCLPAAMLLRESTAKSDPGQSVQIALVLRLLVERLGPEEAEKLCVEAAETFSAALEKTPNPYGRGAYAYALSLVAERAGPRGAKLCADAARAVSAELGKSADPQLAPALATSLAATARWAGDRESADACAAAARSFRAALATAREPQRLMPLAVAIAELSARLSERDARDACAEAARALAEAIKEPRNAPAAWQLASVLANVAGRMRPSDAVRACAEPAQTLITLLSSGPTLRGREDRVVILLALASRLEPRDGVDLLLSAFGSVTESRATRQLAQGLAALARGVSAEQASLTAAGAARAAGALAGPGGGAHAAAQLRLLPEPKPLAPVDLVELLKHPYCVGEARRAVLEALEGAHGRKFADQWEFAGFAAALPAPPNLLAPPRRQARPKAAEGRPPVFSPFGDL